MEPHQNGYWMGRLLQLALGRLHTHAMICITKRGLDTKLDYSGVKKYFDNNLGYDVHFKSQLFRDAQKELKNYINKKPM